MKDILRRPAVVRQVLEDPSARHILHQASQRRYAEEDSQVDTFEPPLEYAEPNLPVSPTCRAAQMRYSEAPREVLELLGVCTTFYTQMQRMIPTLHVAEYDENTKRTLVESIERVRAAAGWAETVINTGDTSMDEALAKLLGGK